MQQYSFQVHPENSDWTCFDQTANLDIKSFFGFENTMEKLGMKQYSANIAKGKEIIEFFINQMAEEGVISVPRWKPSSAVGDSIEDAEAK